MFLEETIEILNPFVTKNRRNRTDFGGWEYAEQVLREDQSSLDLELHHCFLIFESKRPLKRSHLNPKFSGNGVEP
jgi:hypothetical protein